MVSWWCPGASVKDPPIFVRASHQFPILISPYLFCLSVYYTDKPKYVGEEVWRGEQHYPHASILLIHFTHHAHKGKRDSLSGQKGQGKHRRAKRKREKVGAHFDPEFLYATRPIQNMHAPTKRHETVSMLDSAPTPDQVFSTIMGSTQHDPPPRSLFFGSPNQPPIC